MYCYIYTINTISQNLFIFTVQFSYLSHYLSLHPLYRSMSFLYIHHSTFIYFYLTSFFFLPCLFECTSGYFFIFSFLSFLLPLFYLSPSNCFFHSSFPLHVSNFIYISFVTSSFLWLYLNEYEKEQSRTLSSLLIWLLMLINHHILFLKEVIINLGTQEW